MLENNPVEKDVVAYLTTIFSNRRRNQLHQASVFSKLIVPNKEFSSYPELVRVAEDLVERLEGGISELKISEAPDRDELLTCSRTWKKDLKGFCVHASKQNE